MAGATLKWKEEKLEDDSTETISRMYDNGFLFTRIEKGVMNQTRSCRIRLERFELNSENRRILKKGQDVIFTEHPIPYAGYSWQIGKMAKDFYDKKAGGTFSANKIRELLTTDHNFNTLFSYSDLGYTICYKNHSLLHYSYPFYDISNAPKDMGLIMMNKTISEAQSLGLQYLYLGSLQRPNDIYKLQFSGIEWFDGEKWQIDLEKVKIILKCL